MSLHSCIFYILEINYIRVDTQGIITQPQISLLPQIYYNDDIRRDIVSCYSVGTPGDRRFGKLVSSALLLREALPSVMRP